MGRRDPRVLRALVATGAGAGFAPWAPGTAGSALGVLLHWALAGSGGWPASTAVLAALTLLGFWSAGSYARRLAQRDPAPIVIDEIVGQMFALCFLAPSVRNLVVGFLLFRLLDIVKPFPARRLEALEGSAGIMADDLVAGAYTNLALHALHAWSPGGWLGG